MKKTINNHTYAYKLGGICRAKNGRPTATMMHRGCDAKFGWAAENWEKDSARKKRFVILWEVFSVSRTRNRPDAQASN